MKSMLVTYLSGIKMKWLYGMAVCLSAIISWQIYSCNVDHEIVWHLTLWKLKWYIGGPSEQRGHENDPMKFIKRSGDITVHCIPAIFPRLTVSWRCTRMIRMKTTQLKLEASDAGEHLQKVGLRVEVLNWFSSKNKSALSFWSSKPIGNCIVLFLAKRTAM